MRKAGAPTKFTAYGYDFTLIKFHKNIALYAQENTERVVGYEVHKLKPQGALSRLRGKSEFGYYAWSYEHRENAEKKYQELLERGAE